ncbi:uncharacterized protein LOC116286409 [Actinia tenebrosa]|uniref:Uncharacterized protein LOC116286409 n=1 Tax=Actinia tenebrosa TaxID=6105 RepID=A0A6P8GZ80_ACTTE|nr:uncharacterized protein LOC116286409 [Actinia tenebrosa]
MVNLRTFTARYLAIQILTFSSRPCMKLEVYGCQAVSHCPKPLGMTSGKIANESLSASSYLGPDFFPWFARLDTKNAGGGWCAASNNISELIQVDLKDQHKLTKIILQGRGVEHVSESAWVNKFSLEYSMDGMKWTKHTENGTQEFEGNTNSDKREIAFTQPIMARFARILTLEWHNWTCLRFEFEGCNARTVPFGFETGEYQLENLISSNQYKENHTRLNQPNPDGLPLEIDAFSSVYSYLQIRIEPYGRVATAIALQGYDSKWISTYLISLSNDGKHFTYYMERGHPKIFEGNKDSQDVSRQSFFTEIRARFMRILPRTINNGYDFRMELYGYEVCSNPLGLQDGRIANDAITASSFNPGSEPWRVRHGTSGSWSPKSAVDSWLQVDVGRIVRLTAVAMAYDETLDKGVKAIRLASKKYIADKWFEYGIQGNDYKVFNCLPDCRLLTKTAIEGDSIIARYIRVIVVRYENHPYMKLELYGCEQVCMEDLGMEASFIKDVSITASSALNQQSLPSQARLNTNQGYGAWCANHTDASPYLQIDLRWLHEVRAISTQGQHSLYGDSWVQQYTMSYLKEPSNETWEKYMESKVAKVFVANDDSVTVVQNVLTSPITVRLLRIHPISWSGKACLRLEVYGCEVSRNDYIVPLGMTSMEIPDQNIIASSYNTSFEPWKARFQMDGWMAPQMPNQFLQIDLGMIDAEILAIGTRHPFQKDRRVLEFFLSFSDEGLFWYQYMEYSKPKRFHNEIHPYKGVQKHFLSQPIKTRYLKFEVARWKLINSFTVSLELYGKKGVPISKFNAVTYSASSYIYSNPPRAAVLGGSSAWCAEYVDNRQFLQLDLGKSFPITGVETANVSILETMNTFIVSSSIYGNIWDDYKEKQTVKLFNVNLRELFTKAILARFVRFNPKNWTKTLCMRAGILSKAITAPLGMSKWRIANSQITATSHAGPGTEPWRARLNSDDLSDAWCAGEDVIGQYLNIDLLYEHSVTHIALQGRFATASEAWVIDYQLLYSMDNIVWNYYVNASYVKILKGNVDSFAVVKVAIDPHIRCRYIRIQPTTWHGRMCLKTEIYGHSILGPIGVNNGDVPDTYISASTYKPNREPWKARLNRNDNNNSIGWEPLTIDLAPFLEIKGIHQMRVIGVSTQGIHSATYPAFVTNYTLKTSLDGLNWIDYVEDGIQKIFNGNNDTFSVVTNILKSEITVKSVRIVPVNWTNGVSLRVELFGLSVLPRDGHYTLYSNWSACSATCGPGFQYRTRNCSNPEPLYGGKNCTRLGSDTQTRLCNAPLCPAPFYAAPPIFKKDQPTTVMIQNCTALDLTIDFGDGTKLQTTNCSIEHTYIIGGIIEIVISTPNHEVTRNAHYVEDSIKDFQEHNTTKAILLGRNFTINWRIDGGTILQLGFNYGDGSYQNSTLVTRDGFQTGVALHQYNIPGVFPIELIVSNLINTSVINLNVIVELAVNVSLTLSTKTIFDRTYEFDDVILQIEVLNGSNPHFVINTDDGTPLVNQTSTTLIHKYRAAALRTPNIVAYNNVSSYSSGCNITINKMDLIVNASLEVHDTIYPNSTFVNLTVLLGNPFLCLINLGDGTLINRTSLDNSTQFDHNYIVGEYTITINCSNHLSYQLLSEKIKVQSAIQKASLAPTAPVVVNHTHTFVITAEDKGSNSCYVVRPGDGSTYGIGKPHCLINHPSVTFLDMQIPFLIKHTYGAIGLYMVTVSGSNAISSVHLEDRAVVVQGRCSYPNISLLNIGNNKQDPTRITRIQSLLVYTKIYIDCDPTTLYNVDWNISLASNNSIGLSYKTFETLTIYQRTLDYGLYQVILNVSMRGLDGVYQFKHGFIEVTANDFIPMILGGHFVRRGLNKSIYFDASETYDPDFTTGEDAFEFYWSCSNGFLPSIERIKAMSSFNRSGLPVFNESGFCRSNTNFYKGRSKINYTTSFMSIGDNYSVAVDVFKDVKGMIRHARFVQIMSLVDGNVPNLYLRCLRNCMALVNPNNKLHLEVFSPDLTDTASYHWRLFREVTSNGTSKWMEIEELRNLTKTELNNRFVVIAPNVIATEERYKLQGTAWMSGGPRGLAEYIYSYNMPPYGGSCDVDIPKGNAGDTLFTFKCSDWMDHHLPLTYQLYYQTNFGVELLLYHSVFPSFAIPLPLGEASNNYTLNMTMRIVDSLGAYNTTLLNTMVVRNESSNMTALLLGYLNFVDGTELRDLMNKGNLLDASIRFMSMLSVLNSMEGDQGHLSLRIQIRTKIAKILSQWESRGLLNVQILASALSQAIALREEVSVATQRHCLNSLSDMSDFIIDQSRDRSVSETTVADTIQILFYGLSNTISASSDSAKVPYIPGLKDINITLPNSNLTLGETSRPSDIRLEAVQISKDTIAKIDDLAKESLNRLASGEEPFKIDVPILSMSLQRINADDIDNMFFNVGKASVRFPNSYTLFGASHGMDQVGVKSMRMKRNVFTWNLNWLRVKTELLLVELKDPVQETLSVSQISQPIHLIIPRAASLFPPPETSFISKERQSLAFHQFNITSLKPMNIRILPVEGKVSFGIYWKYAMRPELNSEDFVGRLPDFSSCKSKGTSYTDCEKDPYTIFIDTTRLDQLGKYFLGVQTLDDYPVNKKERVRRSACEGSGRSKRSCLEYKTPPPSPSPNMGGPIQYDPRFHFNYTIQRFYSPCLFWDAQNDTWSEQGCSTGNFSTYQHVHCKCTHLTSFGGDLLVAPNPIDFDKVFAGFANISDNMAVLGVIITAFSIYTILAVWLRRLDKRDAARGGISVIKSTIDSTEDHPYEVIVQTGSWSNSGTSSNVFLTVIGEEGESAAIHLTDKYKSLFNRGGTDEFIVLLPKDIGKIHFLRIWHDMTGPSSSWYLNYIIVRNIKTGAQFNFVSDQWFALEKEDGAIDRVLRVSAKEEMTNFKTLFRQKTEKDICDGHLWISVMAKPPKSTFTRVQRLSCCMSLLFTSMITNAMFYNIGNEPDTSSITLGPITISIKQIIIGIQSSFIALPINIIILQIFQKAKAKENTMTPNYKQPYSTWQDEGDAQSNKRKDGSSNAEKKGLPHWTVYIAWTLCVLATVVSAAFTLFYSMMWGKETSNKWISSMLVSFFQDAFVTQPLKIFLLALFIATFLKKIPQEFTKKDTKEQELDSLQVQEPGNSIFNEDMMASIASRCQPPNEDLVRRARDYKMKELRMHGIIKENIFFAVFLLALLGVSYSIRDYESFRQTSNIKAMFTEQVNDNVTLWTFVENTVLKFSFSRQWYNGRADGAEGFTEEKKYYMVGMPRLRQVRVKKENCTLTIVKSITTHCVGEYSIPNEDTSYYLPGWKEPGNLTSEACPIPWRYQTSWELDGIPLWGHKAVYNGGGFTADLGYEMWQAADVASTLKKYNWVDELSRAVVVEFTIFDPHVNLFSMVTYVVEITGTGSGSSFVKVDTFKLYLHLGPSKMLLIFCEVLSIIICLILTFYTCKKIKTEGLKYFRNKWNLLESAQLGLCYAAVGLFIVRLTFTAKAIQKLQENPFLFVSFQYIAKWHEVNVYVIGIIVFIATMKFLRLMKFNRHIAILSRTISNCLKDVAIIGFQALLVFTAFSIFAYVTFGTKMEDFSTYILALQSQLTMMLGKGYFTDLSQVDPVLGPVYFTLYIFAMMFFLLNMFIAVIADSYAEECTGVDPDSEEFVMAGFMMDRLRSLFSKEKQTTEPWVEIKCPEYKDWPGTKQEALFEKARQSHEMLKIKEKQLDYIMQGLLHAEKNIAKSEESIAWKTMAILPSRDSKKYNKVALMILLTEEYIDENEEEADC